MAELHARGKHPGAVCSNIDRPCAYAYVCVYTCVKVVFTVK